MIIFKIIWASILWDRVFDKAAHKDYDKAVQLLNRLYGVYGRTMPSNKVPVETNLLCAMVSAGMNNYELNIESSQVALRQLDRNVEEYSDADIEYLTYYCRCHIIFSNFNIGNGANVSGDAPPPQNETLRKVSDHLKRNFPLYNN